jgi:hypothetical protein
MGGTLIGLLQWNIDSKQLYTNLLREYAMPVQQKHLFLQLKNQSSYNRGDPVAGAHHVCQV